jgi:peptidoglycan/LPS O-acetylase OafA/YrhL
MNKKIYSLESLRGIAALIVALYHYPSTSYLHFKDGYLAVYFFFSLSGFVITLNYFNKINNFNSLIKFQIKRYFRIYPIHLFTLLIVLSIQLLKLILLKFFYLNSANEAFHPSNLFSVHDFIQHLFLTQSVTNFGYFLSWNAAAWTISAEFYAYLVFGLLALIARGNKLIFIIILLLYILFSGLISLNFGNYINPVFLTCLLYFFSGCIVFFIYEKTKFRINDFFFIIFLFTLIAYNKFYELDNSILFSICIFLVLIAKQNTFINKVLNFKPLVYFGTISYSFYMMHQSILYLYIQSLKLIFDVSFDNKNGVTTDTGDPYYDSLITISYIAISIIISAIIYRYIEQKFRR